MGILTEEELRNPEFYTKHYQCKNQALERDMMQVQAAIHEVQRARLQIRGETQKLANQNHMMVQLHNQLRDLQGSSRVQQ